jgi:hypothetical protein
LRSVMTWFQVLGIELMESIGRMCSGRMGVVDVKYDALREMIYVVVKALIVVSIALMWI